MASQLPPSTGPSIFDLLKNWYGDNTNTPDAPSAADIAYAKAQADADSQASSGISGVGSAINNGLNKLFNLPTADSQNLAPMGYGGQGGQATDVSPMSTLAALQAPQPTAAQLQGVVGAPVAQKPAVASPMPSQDINIAQASTPPDVTVPDAGVMGSALSNTDRESNPLQAQLGIFNAKAADLAQNPDPVAAKGLLGSLGDTLGTYADKLKSLNPAVSQGLITTGLGILAGNNGKQSLTQLVGSAGAQGVGAYNTAKQLQLTNAQAAAKAAQTQQQFNLDVAKARSEDAARQTTAAQGQSRLSIEQQNADTAKQKANAEMRGTAKWTTIPDGNGGYVQQGFDKDGNPTSQIPASAEDIQKLTNGKAPSEGQSKALGYAARMDQNEQVIQNTYQNGVGLNGWIDNKLLPDALTSDGYKQYQASKNNWIAALLRQESGAAIGKDEYNQADKQYFPQPGDSADLVAQKAALRQTALASMQAAAATNGPQTPAQQNVQASVAAGKAPIIQHQQATNAYTQVIQAAKAGNPQAQAAAKAKGWSY